jgi:hypothetical protein
VSRFYSAANTIDDFAYGERWQTGLRRNQPIQLITGKITNVFERAGFGLVVMGQIARQHLILVQSQRSALWENPSSPTQLASLPLSAP